MGIEDDELEGRKRWHRTQREDRRLKGLLAGTKRKRERWEGRNREARIERRANSLRENETGKERRTEKGERGKERGGGGGDLIRSSNDPGAVFPSLSRWITHTFPRATAPVTHSLPLIHGHRRGAQRPYVGLATGSVGSRNPNLKVKFPRGNGRCRIPLSLSLFALVACRSSLRPDVSRPFSPSFFLRSLSDTLHPTCFIRWDSNKTDNIIVITRARPKPQPGGKKDGRKIETGSESSWEHIVAARFSDSRRAMFY